MSRRGHTIARTAGWAAATLVVTLSGRTLAYALQPGLSSDGRELAAVTGGPVRLGSRSGSRRTRLSDGRDRHLARLARGQRAAAARTDRRDDVPEHLDQRRGREGGVALRGEFAHVRPARVVHPLAGGARLARPPLPDGACASRRHSASGRPLARGCCHSACRLAPVRLDAPDHPAARRPGPHAPHPDGVATSGSPNRAASSHRRSPTGRPRPTSTVAPVLRAAAAVRSPSERKHDSDDSPIQVAPATGPRTRDARRARRRGGRVGACDRQPAGRQGEGAAAVHALGSRPRRRARRRRRSS